MSCASSSRPSSTRPSIGDRRGSACIRTPPLGGDGNALEHLDAGGNLQWLAVIVGIAARWNEPAEFKICAWRVVFFPRSLWRSSGYGRRQMLLCTGAHSVIVGASPVNNGHLDIGVPRPAQGRTRGTIVALDWIGERFLSRKGQLPTWRIAQMIHVIAIITAKPGMREQSSRNSAPTCRRCTPKRAASNTARP